MLVLSRHVQESIRISRDGKDLTLVVTRLAKDQHGKDTVRLGFIANSAADFEILRGELIEQEDKNLELAVDQLLM